MGLATYQGRQPGLALGGRTAGIVGVWLPSFSKPTHPFLPEAARQQTWEVGIGTKGKAGLWWVVPLPRAALAPG